MKYLAHIKKIFSLAPSFYFGSSLLIIFVWFFLLLNAFFSFSSYSHLVGKKIDMTKGHLQFFLKNELVKEWIAKIAPPPIADSDSPLVTFHFAIDQKAIDSLNADLPTSGKDHYVKAYMRTSDDHKTRKIKLRYRGDNFYHWFFRKKSLRIKLSKGDLYHMESVFNLINPPELSTPRDVAYYKIARKLGLLAPEYFPVRVIINGEFMGVYMFLSQVNENLLRRSKVMPGSIYYGDGYSNQLWFDSTKWIKKSARNKEQKADRSDIKLFINKINAHSEQEFVNFVEEYIDKKKFFTYIALDRLFGSSHHDMTHNHKIYFDPYKGKFEPIAWDLRLWAVRGKDNSLYPLLLRLKANPVYDAEIDKILFNLLEQGYIEKTLRIYDDTVLSTARDLKSDIYKDTVRWLPRLFSASGNIYPTPYTMEEIYKKRDKDKELLLKRKEYLYSILNTSLLSIDSDKNHDVVNVRVNGNSPVSFAVKNVSGEKYSITCNGHSLEKNIHVLYPGRKWDLGRLRYDAANVKKNKIVNVPFVYTFHLHGMRPDELIADIEFTNTITGKNVQPKKEKVVITSSESDINPYKFVENSHDEHVVLKGEIDVVEDRVYSANKEVTILPGTVFRMGEDVSIYFYGKVSAIGSPSERIRFVPKKSSVPWGSVIVQGKLSNDSKFEYCNFSGGSTTEHNLIRFTAPFNVHDTNNFRLSHCHFGENYIGDDSVHIAYSDGFIDSCVFSDARSDGLDIDIGSVVINRSVFINSGNDALDIMTTKAVIEKSLFVNAGDKGASIGEWSDVKMDKNIFINDMIGIEIKDKSRVDAENILIINSHKKAINLYNKNKRYDAGGFLVGNKIYLFGNIRVDTDSLSKEKARYFQSLPADAKQMFTEIVPKGPYRNLVLESIRKYAR